MDAPALEVRRRLPAALVGLIVFAALGRWSDAGFFSSVAFGIGVGTFASATFVEPFFTRPQDALVNCLAGVVAFAAVTKPPERGLWDAWLVLVLCVLVGSVAAILIGGTASRVKLVGRRLSARFGRAAVVGPTALALVAIDRFAAGSPRTALFVGGVAALTGLVAVNWDQLLNDTFKNDETAGVALAAVGPRMLLTSTPTASLVPGAGVIVTGRSTMHGTVIAKLPHATGPRYQIALDADCSTVCSSFPTDITVSLGEASTGVVGIVAEGSSDVAIEFDPLSQLRLGAPIALDTDEGSLVYQISALRLRTTTWGGASAVVPHATARQVGLLSQGWISGVDYLPKPHQAIRDPGTLTGELPEGFYRIGRVKGTEVPIGIQRNHRLRGHLAILGMSGMGKTAVADRIASELSGQELVVALDLTGEYASRLAFAAWDEDLDGIGRSVYEPVGDPTVRAADLVKAMMQHAAGEFTGGDQPRPRNILFEEAHSFIPEWNFATPNQRDNVNNTTRMIMQARKYGLRFIIVSQRTAVVSKSGLSQCDSYIVFRTIDHTGLEYIESLAGTSFRDTLSTLLKHEALCIGPAFNADRPVVIELDAPAIDPRTAAPTVVDDSAVAEDPT